LADSPAWYMYVVLAPPDSSPQALGDSQWTWPPVKLCYVVKENSQC
jgi:hypothetical protein